MSNSAKIKIPISIAHFKSHFTSTDNLPPSSSFAYVFPIEKLSNQFYIEIVPIGTNPSYISVFLKNYSVEDEEEIKVRIELSIINYNGEKCLTKLFRGKFSDNRKSTDKAFSRYIHQNYLLDPVNGFLKNETINLSFEIEILNSTRKIQSTKSKPLESSNQTLPSIWQNGKSGDFVFVFAKTEVRAHKEILVKNSTLFQNLIFESNQNRIDVEENHYDALMEVLKYLYEETIDLKDVKSVIGIYEIAFEFKIHKLVQLCESNLLPQLNPNSVVDLLLYAHKQNALQFKSLAAHFIGSLPSTFMQSETFQSKVNDPALIVEIYNSINKK